MENTEGRMSPEKIKAACKEACIDMGQLDQVRRESGSPLPTSEVLAVGLQRLMSHGVEGKDWLNCLEYLQKESSDLRFQRLISSAG